MVWPPIGWVRFGHLRRLDPISREWGFDRGLPADRYYIESFLAEHQGDIRGRVLEVVDSTYTRRFGGANVTQADVVDLQATEQTTLVGDLGTGAGIPHEAFDCMVLTQVLHLIDDLDLALLTCYRALKPGGVLLATLPGICKICRDGQDRWWDAWRFTSRSAYRHFANTFPAENVEVTAYGNVLVAIAFLTGLSTQELRSHELKHHDPDYEITISVRAVKPGGLP